MKKSSTEEFVSKCREIYGDAYDYSCTNYVSSKLPVEIVCRKHGKFAKSPNLILAKRSGCPKCGNARKGLVNKLTEQKVLQALADKYPGYAPFKLLAPYTRNTDTVQFTCSTHGEQCSTVVYLRGLDQPTPCPVCNTIASFARRRTSQEDFILACRAVHGDRYGYDDLNYVTSQDKVTVICSTHKAFTVEAESHRLGTGCPKCYWAARQSDVLPFNLWLSRARKVHGDKYGYIEESYKGTSQQVRIVCPTHGEFSQLGNSHTAGSECPKCAAIGSKGQRELTEYLRNAGLEVLTDHKLDDLSRLEVDCYIPDKNLAIEYDGLKWHSTQCKSSGYHKVKRSLVERKGVSLIRIFEDEWLECRHQVESLLKMRLGLSQGKLHARKCKLVEIDNLTAQNFYNSNHIQGWRRFGKHAALEFEGTVVAVMTFTQNTSERGKVANKGAYELARFASSMQVVGGASRLFKALIEELGATTVVSYSDNRLFSGKVYTNLGFSKVADVPPSYTYWKEGQNKRLHKSHFRHSNLAKILGDRYNPNLTERANCEAAGYYQVYDCGLTKWVWRSAD